jgi:pimeloyl-ACP methyl ester carboxylesterase
MFISPLPDRRSVAGAELEIFIKGEGQPLLFLHAGHGVSTEDPLIDALAKHYKVIAPSHPGFGASPRPDGVDTVDDIAYVYLDLIEDMGLTDVILVGVSFGGWIAAELATKGTGRFSRLVLIDTVGAKFSDRETRDIVDIFATTVEDIPGLFFSDRDKAMAALGQLDFQNMSEDTVMRFARNREAMVLYGWAPTLFNPKLRGRLHRIRIPTLVLWGAEDKIVAADYGRQFAAGIDGAKFETVDGTGHYGYLEKPEAFAERISAFLKS